MSKTWMIWCCDFGCFTNSLQDFAWSGLTQLRWVSCTVEGITSRPKHCRCQDQRAEFAMRLDTCETIGIIVIFESPVFHTHNISQVCTCDKPAILKLTLDPDRNSARCEDLHQPIDSMVLGVGTSLKKDTGSTLSLGAKVDFRLHSNYLIN